MATGKYTYLSWIRKGMATRIQEVETLGKAREESAERASVNVSIRVKSTSGKKDKQFDLLGPGDIKVRSVKKSDAMIFPEDRHRNAAFNNFAYIQFFEEDFPWRFSPAKANAQEKLRPWLQLVALKESEFDNDLAEKINPDTNYRILKINASVPVPSQEEAHLWAHVQIDQTLSGNNLTAVEDIITSDPDAISSRILCPRKLEAGTKYHVFLIPAFERGRLAGIGKDKDLDGVDMQQYAFSGNKTAGDKDFPIYHSWSFTTSSAGGDFEELARKLKKVDSNDLVEGDRTIGSRKFLALDIGDSLKYTGNHLGEEGQMEMNGALLPEGKKAKSLLREPEADQFTEELAVYLNDPLGESDYEEDPIIMPPVYGRHHAKNTMLDSNAQTWINEVNLDPGNRLIAGLGAEVFREHQDQFMQEAWEQQGAIEEANRKINVASLIELTNSKLHSKYIKHADDARTIAMTSLLHGRIQFGSTSVKKKLEESTVPTASLSKVFQESISSGSTMLKTMDGATSSSLLSAIQLNKFTVATSYDLDKGGYILSKGDLKASAVKVTKTPTLLSKMSVTPSAGATTKRKEQLALKNAFGSLSAQLNQRKGTVSKGSSVNVSTLGKTITKALIPSTTILAKLNGIIQPSNGVGLSRFEKIMAYPVITRPISTYLKGKHLDMFIPQIDLLPDNSVTILSANQKYIESLLLGFNYEMARELVWRDYPTDQKGSYARIFWEAIRKTEDGGALEPANLADQYGHINEIHLWKRGSRLTRLGNNTNPKNNSGNNLVVVFRGELLNYYPNTLIYFQKAKKLNGSSKRTLMEGSGNRVEPEFIEKIGRDIHLIGFDLSAKDAKGDNDGLGYFLVLQEPPGENKFGMDISSDGGKPAKWSDLAWDQFRGTTEYVTKRDFKYPAAKIDNIKWGRKSNEMAYILNQKLFKYAVHADKLI